MMGRTWLAVLTLVAIVACANVATAAGAVTFNKDVLPILQKNCQSCHRPGNIAPMSFLSYETTRPWAKAMKTAVVTRKMPPWFADPQYNHFSNDPSLKQAEIDTIVEWVDSGAVQGDAKDAPRPIEWPENGWTRKPDIILKGLPFAVDAAPKNNVIEWLTLRTPTGFTEDTWVTSVEIKPSQLAVTHHICVSFVSHLATSTLNTFLWADKQRDGEGVEVAPAERKLRNPTADGRGREITTPIPTAGTVGSAGLGVGFTCYVPGRSLSDFHPFNAAFKVPAGSDVLWTLHYTPNGAKLTDVPEIGLTVAKETPQHLLIEAAIALTNFAIPPKDANYEAPPAEFTFLVDAQLHWMSPHMHLRGKDMKYKLIFPDGREQVVLNVPRYDFNWQLGYDLEEPISVPKGTKLVVTAHYDNSANNKFNPDPNRTVYNGQMTWEEMFAPFFAVTVDPSTDPNKAFTIPRASVSGGA